VSFSAALKRNFDGESNCGGNLTCTSAT